jgi:predicted site-specific integrase-resolvase
MDPSPPRKRIIGYARVSTEDQAHDAQLDELRAAGCAEIHQEHGSGASQARPVLARLIPRPIVGCRDADRNDKVQQVWSSKPLAIAHDLASER